MHELIRQYSSDQLVQYGLLEETGELHLEYFLALAEQSRRKLRGPEQSTWFKLLEENHDNIRAALEWSMRKNMSGAHVADEAAVRKSLRLVSALYGFWAIRGDWSEGRKWLQRALTQSSGLPATLEVVDALNAAALLAANQADIQSAWRLARQSMTLSQEINNPYMIGQAHFTFGILFYQGRDYVAARNYCERGLIQFRELDMKVEIGEALHLLSAIGITQGDLEAAQSHAEECLSISQELGDQYMLGLTLTDLGNVAYLRKDFNTARSYFEKSQRRFREAGAMARATRTHNKLGDIARCEQDYERAEQCYTESLMMCREAGDKEGTANILPNLGYIAEHFGDFARAMTLCRDGLAMQAELGNQAGIADCLVGIAVILSAQDQVERAARLLGAVEAIRERVDAVMWPANRMEYENCLSHLHKSIDEETFHKTWKAGRLLSIEQAMAEATGQI